MSKVYIVGAGLGDPELLTVKAHKLITEFAEIVVYDRLISDEIIALIPKHVERVYAGKSCREHVMTQDEINAELVKQSNTGKKVVRLKGGDPFIFGRGGEEIEYLHKNGIEFEVIPGISAASGIAAKLGIPLTHRNTAHSVRYVTGHQQKGNKMELDWKSLADQKCTLVVYMGLANLANITENLIKYGMPNKTACAAIQEGTCTGEKVHFGSLDNIAFDLKKLDFLPPTIVIIGKVVEVCQALNNK